MRGYVDPGSCLVCDKRVGQFWGTGAFYLVDGEPFTDISVLGFCKAHRDESLVQYRAITEAKGTDVQFFEPPVELRADETHAFLTHMSDELGSV